MDETERLCESLNEKAKSYVDLDYELYGILIRAKMTIERLRTENRKLKEAQTNED